MSVKVVFFIEEDFNMEALKLTMEWDKTFPKSDNKRFISVPGTRHTDLYDGGENKVIPYVKIEHFYREYLK